MDDEDNHCMSSEGEEDEDDNDDDYVPPERPNIPRVIKKKKKLKKKKNKVSRLPASFCQAEAGEKKNICVLTKTIACRLTSLVADQLTRHDRALASQAGCAAQHGP